VKREAGRVYVLLAGAASRDESTDESQLVAVLREQLAAERQAHAEARRIIAGLVERIPAIEASSEARESPETVEEEPDRAESHSATGGTQEGVRRPWWRRMFRWWGTRRYMMNQHENLQELLMRLNNVRDSMEVALGYVSGIEDDYRRGMLEAHIKGAIRETTEQINELVSSR
jgi:hypothetical protein